MPRLSAFSRGFPSSKTQKSNQTQGKPNQNTFGICLQLRIRIRDNFPVQKPGKVVTYLHYTSAVRFVKPRAECARFQGSVLPCSQPFRGSLPACPSVTSIPREACLGLPLTSWHPGMAPCRQPAVKFSGMARAFKNLCGHVP